jgi:hypothetical protein
MVLPLSIDKNVPLPRRRRPWKYNWDEMAIGDSFLVTDVGYDAARSAAWSAQSRRPGQRFETRREGRGTRIFRVK